MLHNYELIGIDRFHDSVKHRWLGNNDNSVVLELHIARGTRKKPDVESGTYESPLFLYLFYHKKQDSVHAFELLVYMITNKLVHVHYHYW